ncbi:DNA oxidative demethylase [Erysiphe necator]|nr:DNA oxidative demethylase [Erysiphe necator]
MAGCEKQISELSSLNISSGDTRFIYNILNEEFAHNAFVELRNEISWERVYHRGGLLPRLIAIQGDIASDGGIPVYRFPADVMPQLKQISPTVKLIQKQVEKEMGHTVNHVLIQYYRDSTDYISEHSDKTLDVVPNTSIGNLSLGVQRTMIFRSKKARKDVCEIAAPRQVVRIPLPHNSLCIMGLETNKSWLHSIRKEKQSINGNAHEEPEFQAARISLTFRNIGTYISEDKLFIWGQGATAKIKESARPLVNDNSALTEKILEAFRAENRDSDFDWNIHYGAGFDLLHIS